MADKEARIVGAGDPVTVDGKEYMVRPIGLAELQELQRLCLKAYRRSYLETFRDNADILGDNPQELIRAEVEKVARWDIGDLPRRRAFDVSRVPMNDAILDLIKDNYGDRPDNEGNARRLLMTMLDAEDVSREKVKELTGVMPISAYISYDNWWITAAFEGMVATVASALYRMPENVRCTEAEIRDMGLMAVTVLARIAESITAPAMGNT